MLRPHLLKKKKETLFVSRTATHHPSIQPGVKAFADLPAMLLLPV